MAPTLDEAIAELRRLNVEVPLPRQLPTEPEVEAAILEAGATIHADFRTYLLRASDVVYGTKEPVAINGGHVDFVGVVETARAMGVPDDLVPICEDNGDYFCVTASGGVIFWSHAGTTDERWPDLATWITEVWIGGN